MCPSLEVLVLVRVTQGYTNLWVRLRRNNPKDNAQMNKRWKPSVTVAAIIERDGSESEAHLRLPPADFDSRVTELINEQLAITNYQLKAQAKHFWDALALLQEIRQGVRASRDKARG